MASDIIYLSLESLCTGFFKRDATFLNPTLPVSLGHWPWPRVMYILSNGFESNLQKNPLQYSRDGISVSVKPIYLHFLKYRLSVSVKVRTDIGNTTDKISVIGNRLLSNIGNQLSAKFNWYASLQYSSRVSRNPKLSEYRSFWAHDKTAQIPLQSMQIWSFFQTMHFLCRVLNCWVFF